MPAGAQATAHPVRPRGSPVQSPPSISSSFRCLFALILLVAVSSPLPSSLALADQAELLRKFKASLTNAENHLADWNTSPELPCAGNVGKWTGVVCFNGNVWGLKLENMSLGGRLDVDSLVPLPFFRTLSVMNNNFEGSMPDWKKLGAMKTLYLSNNKFSGQVPADAFKGMNSLKKIHLANNQFTGPIPSSLESPKLIELRLENNKFDGQIPEISSELLKVFNVSNNQLHGPIPENLQKLHPSSFSGNQGLCGKPLETSCADIPLPATEKKSSWVSIAILVALGLLLIVIFLAVIGRKRRDPTPQLGREIAPPRAETSAPVGKEATGALGSSIEIATSGEELIKPAGGKKPGSNQAGRLTFVKEEDKDKFDLQDLMRASAEVLGSGTFGASYKAVLMDGEFVVVKRFKQMNGVAREDFHEHMRRLGRLKHPNLLPLVAYLYRREEKLLVFDFVNNGSLAKHLHGKRPEDQPGLSWENRLKIIKGVAKGMSYLHNELPSLSLPHGHLKSSNVLLDDDFNPLLTDYSLSPVVNPNQVHQVLVAYKAPEYAKNFRVTKETDVWCLGILILEILTGKFVIAQGCGHQSADLAGWISAIVQEVNANGSRAFDKELKGSVDEKCVPEMEKLLKIGIGCCEEDLEKRLSIEEAIKRIEHVKESSIH